MATRFLMFLIILVVINSCDSRKQESKLPQKNNCLMYPAKFENGKWGYINRDGQTVINPIYLDAKDFTNEIAVIIDTNSKAGIINTSGIFITNPEYDNINLINNHIAIGYKGKKNYLINLQQNSSKEMNYDIVDTWKNDLLIVSNYGYYGIIDKNLKIVLPLKYELILCSFKIPNNPLFLFDYAIVRCKGKEGYVDPKGYEFVPPKYDIAMPFQGGYAKVLFKGRWGIINNLGKEFIIPEFENIFNKVDYKKFAQNKNVLLERQTLGMFDFLKDGFIFAQNTIFNNGWAAVEKNEKWGFIDINGKELIKLQFEDVRNFSDNLAGVKMKGKWGFISSSGELIIDYKYKEINNFKFGTAIVKDDSGWILINKKGARLSSIHFDDSYDLTIGLPYQLPLINIICHDKNSFISKHGLINRNGEIILQPIYDKIQIEDKNYLNVVLNGKEGLFSVSGKEMAKPIYNVITNYHDKVAGFEIIQNNKKVYGLINKNGHEIILKDVINLPIYNCGLAQVRTLDRKIGYIDCNGKWIFGPF